MDLSPLVNLLNSPLVDGVLLWTVAAVASVVGLVGLVNALDMYLDTETS
ncbi:hypothetical protein [Variovorax arabinosiphilus]|nr:MULTISPECIES: hypothetical protein [unclassified Variovorax]MDM0119919.1 hypothetical protein [Variovorax sp. J2L1-78]MDM0128169.1 hypothetical protein [Variovorax sp. J2L1-63]MDM0231869.1 hypothetical protein [Variovorax sp. J2R1-6]